ncbi:MAG TPA: hypothetical protein VKE74_32535 [Gemmataceae bacterium]|nr:hypothetical protein [Gemmataceae bacterium]
MTASTPNPGHPFSNRTARWLRRLAVVLLGLAVAAGCKGKDGTGGLAKGPDPLMGGPGRIPPQNVPVPDRGTAGTKGKSDPLIAAPTSRPGDRTGAGYTDDPARWKGAPYVPNMGSTPAALAGQRRDGEELKIESPGVPLRPAGGTLPAPDADLAAEADTQLQQLREYGVAKGSYSFTRENGQIVFRANVPNPTTGATSGLTGVGATPAEAVKQVLDQAKSQRR